MITLYGNAGCLLSIIILRPFCTLHTVNNVASLYIISIFGYITHNHLICSPNLCCILLVIEFQCLNDLSYCFLYECIFITLPPMFCPSVLFNNSLMTPQQRLSETASLLSILLSACNLGKLLTILSKVISLS